MHVAQNVIVFGKGGIHFALMQNESKIKAQNALAVLTEAVLHNFKGPSHSIAAIRFSTGVNLCFRKASYSLCSANAFKAKKFYTFIVDHF